MLKDWICTEKWSKEIDDNNLYMTRVTEKLKKKLET